MHGNNIFLFKKIVFSLFYIIYWMIRCGLYINNRLNNEINSKSDYYGFSSNNKNLNVWSNRHLLEIGIVKSNVSLNCTPLAINNFPNDAFSQSQRQHGAVVIHILVSVYMFVALALLCDEYFIPCLEIICKSL